MNAVIHADALEHPADAAEGADVMIVDPPYSAAVHTKATSCGMQGLRGPHLRGVRKRDLGFEFCSPELMLRIAEYAALVRRWSIVFCDAESTHLWRAAMALQGVEYVRSVPWVRWSQPQLSGDRPPSGREEILVFHRAERAGKTGRVKPIKKRWNGPGGRISYTAKSLRGADKYSCEKPLDLMLAIVSDFSDPGELVFDPCAGMGTTCVAATLLGREAIGLERKAEVAEEANARTSLASYIQNPFGGPTSTLTDRDRERVLRWCTETSAEAVATPAPKAANGSDVKTWERAQRRLADVARVERALKGD